MLRIGQVESTAQDGKYTDGNVATGISATRIRAAALNAMQEELANIIEEAGNELDASDDTQVLTALMKIFGTLSTTGNAGTATKLQTARTISGVLFDGSSDITLSAGNVGAYTKTEIDEALNDVVTLDTAQTISGAKIFTGTFQDMTTHLGRLTSQGPVVLTDVAQLNALRQGGTLFINATGSTSSLTPGAATTGFWFIHCIAKNDTTANSGMLYAVLQGSPHVVWYGYFNTGGVVTWVRVITDTAVQDITGAKTFTGETNVNAVFRVARAGATINLVNTQTADGVIGKSVIFYNPASSLQILYDPSTSSSTGRIITTFPKTASGTVLVSGNNAVADSRGYWKTPDSTELTPSSIGALAVTELVGIPLPYPGTVAPSGWLKCNGQTFDKTTYPQLAISYPSGVLPDLRGEFIRGFDDGRGVDSGRVLLSTQAAFMPSIPASGWGVDGRIPSASVTLTAGRLVVGSGNPEIGEELESINGAGNDRTVTGDIRPRNIAFNYIVRAA